MDLAKLKEPFPVDAVSWRVGSTTKKAFEAKRTDKRKGQALPYLDARDVMDRLDEVCGPANWRDSYELTSNGVMLCKLEIRIDGEWVWKSDGAGQTDMEAEKGQVSDALKRVAVKWGIGRYLYAFEAPWIDLDEQWRIPRDAYADLRKRLPNAKPSLSPPKQQETKREASKPDENHAPSPSDAAAPPQRAAGSVAPASPRKTVNDIPEVKPTKDPVPGKGQFATHTMPSHTLADQLIAKLRIQKAAIRKDGANLDDVLEAYAKWKTETQNAWEGIASIDRRRIKQDQGLFDAKLAEATKARASRPSYIPKPAKAAEAIDPDTGEVLHD